ncbi:17994_t:CDS:2 [Entrophospora sp. SA101]|nr:9747_t:CDS:2 [Entrophospora sp. SA101]CAJ0766272.1 17994_t:CDS:2 [Entrophospora sp. SA101]
MSKNESTEIFVENIYVSTFNQFQQKITEWDNLNSTGQIVLQEIIKTHEEFGAFINDCANKFCTKENVKNILNNMHKIYEDSLNLLRDHKFMDENDIQLLMKEIHISTDNNNKITSNTFSSSLSSSSSFSTKNAQIITKSIPQLVEYLASSLENFNQELMLKVIKNGFIYSLP